MSEQILSNPAALNALKRHQLVSLSKRYGLKASGKNGDMVERLQTYAAALPAGEDLRIPTINTPSTPHHINADFIPVDHSSPTPTSPSADPSSAQIDIDQEMPIFDGNIIAALGIDKKASMMSVASANWDRMSSSGASFISPMKGVDEGSVRSWKSSGNGQPLDDFGTSGMPEAWTTSSRSSVFSFASSLRRSGTKAFRAPRSTSQSSNLTLAAAQQEVEPEMDDEMESMPVPPSPASTVGIPRRHSRLSLFERPSTLRLCSPTPGPALDTPRRKKGSDLPFVGSASKLQELKNRRSMAATGSNIDHTGLNRKSMPALANYTSASLSSIYPPLPGFHADEDAPPVPPIPGQYPAYQPLKHQASDTFTFGSPDHAVSSTQFSEAAQAILQQMNASLPEDARMNGEVLRGNKADMKRMVSVTSGLGGEGGWGLMERFEGKKDRFAAAHEKEFAKMSSISTSTASRQVFGSSKAPSHSHHDHATPGQKRKLSAGAPSSDLPSAPNGSSMGDGGRQAKRTRMSPGPNVLGSLREAGRSVMTLLGDGEAKSPDRKRIAGKNQKSRLSTSKGTGLRSRLSMFRNNFRRPMAGEMTARERSAQLQKSLRRRSAEFSANAKHIPDVLPINPPMSLYYHHATNRKERMPSTSAQTVMLTASSKIPQRKPLPDFGGRITSASSARPTSSMSSTNAAGLPRPKSSSLTSTLRKQSQADLIKNARPAPAPPLLAINDAPLESENSTSNSPKSEVSTHRPSSTLYASTASSRARMQATVKPLNKAVSRPLPMAPPPLPASSSMISPPTAFKPYAFATTNRFGTGESRENLFEENFHRPAPPNPSSPSIIKSPLLPAKTTATNPKINASGPSSSPFKPAGAASRIRHKNSGLSAIKSKGNLKEEVDMQRRRAEIRAKAERRNEEKELREMLGDI